MSVVYTSKDGGYYSKAGKIRIPARVLRDIGKSGDDLEIDLVVSVPDYHVPTVYIGTNVDADHDIFLDGDASPLTKDEQPEPYDGDLCQCAEDFTDGTAMCQQCNRRSKW